MAKAGELNPKQQRFVEEYLVDFNATQAAIRAGYAKKSAAVQACQLLMNPKISGAVSAMQAKTAKKLEVTREAVVDEARILAFSDLSEIVRVDQYGRIVLESLDQLPPEARRCIESIRQTTVEVPDGKGGVVEKVQLSVKLHNKVAGLQLLAKLCGFEAPTKLEHSGTITVAGKRLEEMSAAELAAEKARLLAEAVGHTGSAAPERESAEDVGE